MIDTDLYDVKILASQEIDMARVAYIKEVESKNEILKYGLIFSTVLISGLILHIWYENNKQSKIK